MQINQKYLVDIERNNNKQLLDWDFKEIGYSFQNVFYWIFDILYIIKNFCLQYSEIFIFRYPFQMILNFFELFLSNKMERVIDFE